jgi:hypothetical protein
LAFSTRAIKHKKYILKVCIFLHFVRVERIGHKSSLRSARDPASLSRYATYSGFRFSTKAKQLAFSTRAIKHKKYILKVCIFLHFVRVERIELSSTAWKAVILPLNYTRKYQNLKPVPFFFSSNKLNSIKP